MEKDNKALPNGAITRSNFELRQRIAAHLPNDLSPEAEMFFNGAPKELITELLRKAFGTSLGRNDEFVRTMRILTFGEGLDEFTFGLGTFSAWDALEKHSELKDVDFREGFGHLLRATQRGKSPLPNRFVREDVLMAPCTDQFLFDSSDGDICLTMCDLVTILTTLQKGTESQRRRSFVLYVRPRTTAAPWRVHCRAGALTGHMELQAYELNEEPNPMGTVVYVPLRL